MRLLRMPLRALVALLGVALLIGSLLNGSAALAATPAAKPALKSDDVAAAKLVRAALEAELQGDAVKRSQSLHDALEASPEYAPARWHSAQVRLGEEWVPVEEVARRMRSDERLAAYRQKRDALIDTADNQRELARWCDKQQLKAQGRVHWTKVLEFEGTDQEAIRALGLQLHEGQLKTRAQIAEQESTRVEYIRAQREWQPRISEWRTALTSDDAGSRARASQELQAFREPLAVPALVAAFSVENKRSKVMNQQLVEALDRIPHRVATDALLQLAVRPQAEEFRVSAAKALGKRSPSSYMPQLIAGLPPVEDVETKHSYTYLVGDIFFREHEIVIRDLEKGTSQSLLLQDFDFPGFTSHTLRIDRMNRQVANTEQQLAQKRQGIEDTRQRIELALQSATGCTEQRSAQQWLTKVDELTESYSPRMVGVPEGPETSRTEIWTMRFTVSCFPAGTPILTADGRVSIETIKPGDQVISQNIETGEIAIQSVQQVTLRPAAPLLEICVGGDNILATRGHPFWVDGEGWRMAKQLVVGQLLHTPNGSVKIERLGEKPAQEAYNLVVSDFGTYFVGESQVLVHDNLPLSETAVLIPGLAARAVSLSD